MPSRAPRPGRRRRRRDSPRTSAGVPSASVRPWSSTWIRSQTSMTSAMLWSIRSTPACVLVANRADDGGELGHLCLGEAGGRLVEEQEARPGRECPRDAELALVAVRERAAGCRDALEAEQLEQLVARRVPRGSAPEPSAATSTFSRTDRAANERLCWNVRASPARPRRCGRPRGDLPARELDRAGGREVEAGEDVDEGRLAGSVRADQADDLVAVQLERDVAERVEPFEGARDGGGPESVSGPPGRSRGTSFCQRVPSGSSSPSASSTSGRTSPCCSAPS